MRTCPNCGYESTERRPLTSRQREILDFIIWYKEECGISPTYATIADTMDYRSLATVHEHVHNLVRKGWIYLEPGESQSIEVLTP